MKKGFTLVDLLILISIFALLLGIIVGSVNRRTPKNIHVTAAMTDTTDPNIPQKAFSIEDYDIYVFRGTHDDGWHYVAIPKKQNER